jgi:hypothetical protein
LPRKPTPRIIMQKARRQPLPRGAIGLRQLVSAWFQVLFHSPCRGSFRLSLALLLRYRSSISTEPWRVVPPDSHRISRARCYLGYPRKTHPFRLRGFHPLRPAFPCRSPRDEFGNFLGLLRSTCRSHDTDAATLARLTLHRFRLIPVRSPLLGESRLLFFPAGTEMFHFPAFSTACAAPRHDSRSVSRSRRSPDHSLLAASRSFSQLCHVLRRLWTPRHPPCTLSSLTTLFASFAVGSRRTNVRTRPWLPHDSQFTLFSKNSSAACARSDA